MFVILAQKRGLIFKFTMKLRLNFAYYLSSMQSKGMFLMHAYKMYFRYELTLSLCPFNGIMSYFINILWLIAWHVFNNMSIIIKRLFPQEINAPIPKVHDNLRSM